jgi:hypothetical protein
VSNEQEELRARLLTYPGATEESVELMLDAYEKRAAEKYHLVQSMGMSNSMAERYLDAVGFPRPPGWHSVFFFPGSNAPRPKYVMFILLLIAGGYWLII